MNSFHPGQLVTLKNNEDAGQFLVMLISGDAKPIKCLPLDETFNTNGFLRYQAYSAEELELFDSSKPSFLTENKLRDLQDQVLPLYRELQTYPAQKHSEIFGSVLTETAKNLNSTDKQLLDESLAHVKGKADEKREAVLHFLAHPRVTIYSKAIMGYFMLQVRDFLAATSSSE